MDKAFVEAPSFFTLREFERVRTRVLNGIDRPCSDRHPENFPALVAQAQLAGGVPPFQAIFDADQKCADGLPTAQVAMSRAIQAAKTGTPRDRPIAVLAAIDIELREDGIQPLGDGFRGLEEGANAVKARVAAMKAASALRVMEPNLLAVFCVADEGAKVPGRATSETSLAPPTRTCCPAKTFCIGLSGRFHKV
jgi:hypothetical protein